MNKLNEPNRNRRPFNRKTFAYGLIGGVVASSLISYFWLYGIGTISFSGTSLFLKSSWADYKAAWSHFTFNRFALLFLLVPIACMVFLWGKRQMRIRHATVSMHRNIRTWSFAVALGYAALAGSLVHVDMALMGPTVPEKTVQHLVKIRNVCAVYDNSGSMTAELQDGAKELQEDEAKARANAANGKTIDGGSARFFVRDKKATSTAPEKFTRSHGAQLAARFLIRNRMTNDRNNTDRYCLLRFDDDLYMTAPLTNDKVAIMLRTAHMLENVGGGTNFVVGLQKSYDYITGPATGPNSTRVIVMMTDGLDRIDAEMRKKFVQMYKDAKIKFYIIGLGDAWKAGATKLDLDSFADELRAVDPASGIVFRASNPGEMRKAIETIDKLEKAEEVIETSVINREVETPFILGALLFMFMFFGICALSRRIP